MAYWHPRHSDSLSKKQGVLLVNLGTPDAPTSPALRRYLYEFLDDPRVVEIPRLLWKMILHGIILRIRPARSAKLYQKVWTKAGSPLLVFSQKQQAALEHLLEPHAITVTLAMRYGKPDIRSGLRQLAEKGISNITVLPLYPQYSCSTTASVFDAVADELKTWRSIPALQFIRHYADSPDWIAALEDTILQARSQYGTPDKLLFSFHGTPEHYRNQGDPYYYQCLQSAELLSKKLKLSDDQWEVCFQSRFGKAPWLQPYIDDRLQTLVAEGKRHLHVICPGFASDCLETLDEIEREYQEMFLQLGGKEFHYIPALNDNPAHIQALAKLILQSQTKS